ncbi:HAD family phosphatase [Pseudenhygromyxa sp. WMMC2535]|uniref:HAD-IA family hydrolase n=1 Tax=Pseudenhygromyxa sp. WMMC2535 TaxID=2712867 RepID=UPI0015527147|nr:HAD family phosphatase [Pseudenhygromyxa sp. WMMC2535]
MSQLPQAVLLDLDGTLVDSESFHAEAIARYMATRGVTLDARERSFVIGHAWQEIHSELRVAERIGDDLPALQAGAHALKAELRAEGIDIQVLDGARELVETLAALDIPTVIVSGSSRREIAEALEVLGFAERLRFYMGAEDYPRGKPAPDGYLAAAARLGVEPARCLVFEDSEAGVASALAAGMRVVATAAANLPADHPGHQDQRRAHRVVAGLEGIDRAFLSGLMREGANAAP